MNSSELSETWTDEKGREFKVKFIAGKWWAYERIRHFWLPVSKHESKADAKAVCEGLFV